MSNRSERREAERLTRKRAFQQQRAQQTAAAAEQSQLVPLTISEAQLNANRANAQLSTGPVTSAGRAVSSRNALKTGLTGRTVLLPNDDLSEYNRRLESALAFHKPVTEKETNLVHSLVDIDWRLDRAVTLETGIYAKGASEFADKFNDQPPAHRNVLIQTETYLKYEKSLRNLNVQEARLQRQRTKNIAELKRLKDERTRRDTILQTARHATRAIPVIPSPAVENGFEFSIAEFASATRPELHETAASRGE